MCGPACRTHTIRLRFSPFLVVRGQWLKISTRGQFGLLLPVGHHLSVVFQSWGKMWRKKGGEIFASVQKLMSFTGDDSIPVPQCTLLPSAS